VLFNDLAAAGTIYMAFAPLRAVEDRSIPGCSCSARYHELNKVHILDKDDI